MEIENKELAVVKRETTRLVSAATELKIASEQDLENATDILSKVKTIGKEIKARKEEITKPLNESLASVRDLFKPIEQSHAEAERIIKNKMLAYQDEQDKAANAAKEKIAAKVESGTMKTETAIKKMNAIPEAQTFTQGKVGAISTRIVKYVQTDEDFAIEAMRQRLATESLTPDQFEEKYTLGVEHIRRNSKIPREFLMPDMKKINEVAIKMGVEIPGVEVLEKKVIAAR